VTLLLAVNAMTTPLSLVLSVAAADVVADWRTWRRQSVLFCSLSSELTIRLIDWLRFERRSF
jgi:hypothetical protein